MISDNVAGFIAAMVAVIGWGTNFIPVKKFDTGDGLFYQWVMCCAIWMSGLVTNLIRDSPQFEPIAMLGGVLWCTGNITAVPVIQTAGLGLGMLLWCSSSMLFGWASGYFGILGVNAADAVNIPALNFTGVGVMIVAMILLFFVKNSNETKGHTLLEPLSNSNSHSNSNSNIQQFMDNNDDAAILHHISHNEQQSISISDSLTHTTEHNWYDRFTPAQRRLLGCIGAILAGIFYGINFNPPTYLQQHDVNSHGIREHSSNALDYVFSHFCGIWITSTFYFLCYCVYKRNQPQVQ